MDPNETVRRLRGLALATLCAADVGPASGWDYEDAAVEMAELVESLDDWLRGGGSLPARWGREA